MGVCRGTGGATACKRSAKECICVYECHAVLKQMPRGPNASQIRDLYAVVCGYGQGCTCRYSEPAVRVDVCTRGDVHMVLLRVWRSTDERIRSIAPWPAALALSSGVLPWGMGRDGTGRGGMGCGGMEREGMR